MNLSALIGGKFISKKNPLQDLLSSLNSVILTNERNEILTDHVIFKLRYNEIYQMKTTYVNKQDKSFPLRTLFFSKKLI